MIPCLHPQVAPFHSIYHFSSFRLEFPTLKPAFYNTSIQTSVPHNTLSLDFYFLLIDKWFSHFVKSLPWALCMYIGVSSILLFILACILQLFFHSSSPFANIRDANGIGWPTFLQRRKKTRIKKVFLFCPYPNRPASVPLANL